MVRVIMRPLAAVSNAPCYASADSLQFDLADHEIAGKHDTVRAQFQTLYIIYYYTLDSID